MASSSPIPCPPPAGQDPTGRRQAEQALSASEERFRLAMDATRDGLWDWDGVSGHCYFSPGYTRMLGYEPEEFSAGKLTWESSLHPDDEARALKITQDCIDGVTSHFEMEYRIRTRSGRWKWILARGQRIGGTPGQRALRVIGTHVDIDNLKEAEAALQEALAFNKQVIKSAQEGIVVYDSEGRIVLMNTFMEAMIGVAPGSLVGQIGADIFQAMGAPAEGLRRALAGEQVVLPPFPWTFPASGRSGWATSIHAPLLGSQGERLGVIETVTDLSELHRAEQLQRQLASELHQAQKLDSLGSLAGGVAHDMNNVLAAIQAVTQTLRLVRAGDPALVKFLDTIDMASTRGRDMVRRLTNFARKDLREPERLDLNRLVREEVELLQRTTLNKVALVMDLEEPLPEVVGEAGSLGSALMNLCVNALDAMPAGGTLTLRTCSCPDAIVQIAVQDDGQGMAPEVLARALEPFFTTKPAGKGTGLGLAMVYATVKAHGGTVSLHSAPGQGTSVRLSLPAAGRAAVLDEPAQAAPAPSRPWRVLLVDDDDLIRASLPILLERCGHPTTVVPGGDAALAFFASGQTVDIVILDLNMPGMNGAETLTLLRRTQPELPVILATGFLDAETTSLLRQDDRTQCMIKPFSIGELERKFLEFGRNGKSVQ